MAMQTRRSELVSKARTTSSVVRVRPARHGRSSSGGGGHDSFFKRRRPRHDMRCPVNVPGVGDRTVHYAASCQLGS